MADRDRYIMQTNEQYSRAEAAEARVRELEARVKELEKWIVEVATGKRLIGEVRD